MFHTISRVLPWARFAAMDWPMKWASRSRGSICAVILLTFAQVASAQLPDILRPGARVTTLAEWDTFIDALNAMAWRANDVAGEVTDFAGNKLTVEWGRYVLAPDVKQRLEALRTKAGQAREAADSKLLQATIDEAAAVLADQRVRLEMMSGFAASLRLLVYHEHVLEPWLARGAETDRARANEQAHALYKALATGLESSLRSRQPAEEWKRARAAAMTPAFSALNAQRERLMREQSALPNPLPARPLREQKGCSASALHLPPLDSEIQISPAMGAYATYYPTISAWSLVSGAVVVRVAVGESACAQRVELVQSSGVSDLDEAALALALDGAFVPKDGKPAAQVRTLRVKFDLP